MENLNIFAIFLGGYYFVNKTISRLPFHLIGLNTNIYYRSNGLVGEDEKDPLQQFSWLTNLLAEMKFKNEKVLMFAHISPRKFERYYEQSGKVSISSTFYVRFFCRYSFAKKLQSQNVPVTKHFRTKKLLIKS